MGKDPSPGMKREEVRSRRGLRIELIMGLSFGSGCGWGLEAPGRKGAGPGGGGQQVSIQCALGSWTMEKLQVTYRKDKTSNPLERK